MNAVTGAPARTYYASFQRGNSGVYILNVRAPLTSRGLSEAEGFRLLPIIISNLNYRKRIAFVKR